MLDEYRTTDVTQKAKQLATAIPGGAPPEVQAPNIEAKRAK